MKRKYLPLYYQWAKTGLMPENGLCKSLGHTDGLLDLFRPEGDERPQYSLLAWLFWASGENEGPMAELDEFTPLRQTIVLFLAAMNDEL